MTRQTHLFLRPKYASQLVTCLFLALLFVASIRRAPGQTQPLQDASAPPTAPCESQSASSDRFPCLRENADRLKTVFEKVDAANISVVERLLKTGKCQINRVSGLIERTRDALRQWNEAELLYRQKWAEVEQLRVEGQQKSLASMELQQQIVKKQIEGETNDREELLRKKATLEKYPKRTEQIIKDIDEIVLEIKESEGRLSEAQKEYDEVTAKVTSMNASLTAQLIDMRQEVNRVQSYGLQMDAFYEHKLKDANEVCNTKRPGASRTPLPGAKPAPRSQP
jgi:chromosome segregation ATPase